MADPESPYGRAAAGSGESAPGRAAGSGAAGSGSAGPGAASSGGSASGCGSGAGGLHARLKAAFDPGRIEERLRADTQHRIKAVLAVHTDTATSVTSDIAAVRRAIDACGHPALLMADVVASLGTVDFRMDEWGVDVAVAGAQKGLMAPPGLAFNAVSPRAIERSRGSNARANSDVRSCCRARKLATS